MIGRSIAMLAAATMMVPTTAQARDYDNWKREKRNRDDGKAVAGAALGLALVGIVAAVAASKKKRDEERQRPDGYGGYGYGYDYGRDSYSPIANVYCYRRERRCYWNGQFNAGWTEGQFGYDPYRRGIDMRASFATALCLGLSVAAFAQPVAGPPTPRSAAANMDLAATRSVHDMLAGDFDDGHIAMLVTLGHHKAVAATCPGFTIDNTRFAAEMELIYDDAKGQPRRLTPRDRLDLERKATLALGAVYGAQIAIAAHDRAAFCEAADRDRIEGKAAKSLHWAK